MRTVATKNEGVYKDYSTMTLHDYSYSSFGSLRFDNRAINTLVGGSPGSINTNKTKKLILHCPTAFSLITKEIIDKELLYNFNIGAHEMSALMENEQLIGYLTSVIGEAALIGIYLNVEWCGGKPKRMPEAAGFKIKPKEHIVVEGELTDVAMSDEDFDKVENGVKLIGVSSKM